MNKQPFILVSIVLAVGIIVTGVLYARESGNVSTLETELADSKEEALATEVELTAAEAQLSTFGGDLTAAETQASTLETELADSKEEALSLEADLAAAETQASILETNLTAAETQVSTLEAQVSTLNAQVSALEAEVSALETALAEQ